VLERAVSSGCSARQVLLIGDDDPQAVACSPGQADLWANKLQQMYFASQEELFQGFNHWSIVADPATHNNREVMAAVAYSWECDRGTYPAFQYVTPGRHLTTMDHDFTDMVTELAARGKLERVAAFRQLQALSHLTYLLTRKTLWDFSVPGLQLRPIVAGEVRVLKPSAAGRVKRPC